ncbi:subtilisin-like protease SBT5.6, partial [Impatiens glandulifera]|uniref:subtilisin-like protease SBT5.6 n=1 Tax=Impatiens glandulifera TaxID=253017 RepID=UPI001FB06FD1
INVQVYVVYLGEHSGEKTEQEIEEIHHNYLHSVKGSRSQAKSSIVYSYKNVINGFSAVLTPQEAAVLSVLLNCNYIFFLFSLLLLGMEGVVSVFHNHPRTYGLHTTRSWDFTSLLEGAGTPNNGYEDLLLKANQGKDIIVGVLDTGIWPESESFNDKGMEPVPASWNGTCQTGTDFNSSHCNRKIVGASYYLDGYEKIYGSLNETEEFRSARDKDGHGTHTASTIGGRHVYNASALGGFARGTAVGGAPLVRLAIYKVCWLIPGEPRESGMTCIPADMLAAMDQAIADGVHVLSISIGGNESIPFDQDLMAIGALHATRRNIVVACSAGNSGPTPSTVTNTAPWILTVAASSIDREFPAPVVLGNGMKFAGQTISPFDIAEMRPLILGLDAEEPDTPTNIRGGCFAGTLKPSLVKGKIVICLSSSSSSSDGVARAGGAGVILLNSYNGTQIQQESHIIPAIIVSQVDGLQIINYTRSATNPMATLIRGTTVLGTKPAPVMAPFTSVGPNGIDFNLLKPDITAPGMNILAAWTEGISPTKLEGDHRIAKYNMLSGTSMSCPHVAAAAALLKAIHPDWSSAAIRSALMTTAGVVNNVGTAITDANEKQANPFQFGSGHFNPSKAVDPGLVYDATYTDYLIYLCSNGYKVDSTFTCPTNVSSSNNLNYPSLAVSNLIGPVTVVRTVTNVGNAVSVYNVTGRSPAGYSVVVSPTTLYFNRIGEKKSFNVTVTAATNGRTGSGFSFGWYSWSDGIHFVRSPIVISSA